MPRQAKEEKPIDPNVKAAMDAQAANTAVPRCVNAWRANPGNAQLQGEMFAAIQAWADLFKVTMNWPPMKAKPTK